MDRNNQPKISILFVDDEEIIRKSFTRELQIEHFSVTAVASGSEAISALDDGHFDLVITDLMMPGIDGFGVLKAVKKHSPQTSVIILTGYGDMRGAIDALRLGADDFTLKPCELEELVYRIRRCLEKQSLLQKMAIQNQQLEEEIAQRRLIEQQLVESENRFRLALDTSSNGVWDRNLRTGEVYFGENWLRTLGYDETDQIYDFESFINLLHPDDRDNVVAMWEAHIQGQTPRYETNFRMRNKSGDWQWILSRGQVVARDGQERPLRIIGTHTDITRLKEIEAELKCAHNELEQRVLERTAELYQSNIALTVLLNKREKDKKNIGEQVLANTAHLINPFLDRLKDSGLTEAQQVLVGIIQANIDELISPFANTYATKLIRLTPAEIQVANLVKLGKRTKEIADILHLSPGTISIHRKNIRKKLDMTHQKSNLQTMLSMNQ